MIKTAEKSRREGSYQLYQFYKRQLERAGLSPEAYEEAVKQLASALRI
jgi:hypothetical protein